VCYFRAASTDGRVADVLTRPAPWTDFGACSATTTSVQQRWYVLSTVRRDRGFANNMYWIQAPTTTTSLPLTTKTASVVTSVTHLYTSTQYAPCLCPPTLWYTTTVTGTPPSTPTQTVSNQPCTILIRNWQTGDSADTLTHHLCRLPVLESPAPWKCGMCHNRADLLSGERYTSRARQTLSQS